MPGPAASDAEPSLPPRRGTVRVVTDLAAAAPLVNPIPVPASGGREPVRIQFACDVGTDVVYTVRPPKAAFALRLAQQAKGAGSDTAGMVDVLYDWIARAFGRDAEEIVERLDADDDTLDLPDVMKLMEVLTERSSGVPPT